MSASCPIGFDVEHLRTQIRAMYDRLARSPDDDFHFHRGIAYAVDRLRYDHDALAALPASATSRFAGVGNPLRIGPIRRGDTVLDHACGAGTDLLLAAQAVGRGGRAIGIDMTPAMRDVASDAAREAGLADVVEIRSGLFEALPVPDRSVDVVISNGVLNLAADKRQVLREIARVLKPGGRLYLADVVVQRELVLEVREDPELWAACIGGALHEPELPELAAEAGLLRGQIVERFDCFGGSGVDAKVSRDLRVSGVNFVAHKAVS